MVQSGTENRTQQWNSAHEKLNNYLNTNIYSYLEKSGGQSSDLF